MRGHHPHPARGRGQDAAAGRQGGARVRHRGRRGGAGGLGAQGTVPRPRAEDGAEVADCGARLECVRDGDEEGRDKVMTSRCILATCCM